MDYRRDELLGGVSTVVSVGTALVKTAKSGHDYYEARKAANEYNNALSLANIRNTEEARHRERREGYSENFAEAFGDIDKEKAKRYIYIGAAIGVPLLAALVLMKKKG